MATAVAVPSSAPSPLSSQPHETMPSTIFEMLKQIRDSGACNKQVPRKFIVSQRERLTTAYDEETVHQFGEIPIIDLSQKDAHRDQLAKKLRDVATEWGFFQLINHDLPLETMREVEAQVYKFFELPAEIKQKLGSGMGEISRLYVGDNTSYKMASLHWAESLYLLFEEEQLDNIIRKVWVDGNREFRDAITKFSTMARLLSKQLLELLAEGLGLESNYLSKSATYMLMRCHFYPSCPWPSDVLGCTGHTDANYLSIIQQDQVGGLQILKDGQWKSVKPVQGALVVNVGDILHALTNGHFKSVMHRVVVNKTSRRLSLGAFFNLKKGTEISAPEELVDETHPRLYGPFTFTEYMKHVSSLREANDSNSRNGMEVLKGFRSLTV